ncbi:type I restriction enzyme HsdR N-terminal domain-containing protein [Conexibacter arvalis]|uniref:Type I restriction enzyme R protein N-terminal domain-containing protein n=1 Tax=Conexibacter arvalis TaxID=912552 RepID=A0A840IAY5_9ACTN|nr:hypothetical protein [Conexibacter arvalis]
MAPSDLQLLADYNFSGRNEEEIRGDWIEPLLRLLGYGLGTRHRILRETQLILDPPVRMLGSSRHRIDFVPTVFNRRLWIIEAKRPQENLFADEHLGQAWSYATDPRIAVPLIVLCDGTRLGMFDVTTPEWTTPVLDVQKSQLAERFDEVFSWLGAPRVAERGRQLHLGHLRNALEAQVDLEALNQTVAEVKSMVEEVRPAVVERRRQIRNEARERIHNAGRAATEKAGMWRQAQHLDGPAPVASWRNIEDTAEIVRRTAPIVRVREFDQIERATTPTGENETRMWFGLRAVRMGAAVLLSQTDGCAEHCIAEARRAAHHHATAFVDDRLLAASYRLQRALGQFGWRFAAIAKPQLDAQAAELVRALEVEEWLRRDGEIGITSADQYKRVALLSPRIIQAQIKPWTAEQVERVAVQTEERLDRLPRPNGLERLQPAGDPWLASWQRDPLRDLSKAILQGIPRHADDPLVLALATELLEHFEEEVTTS